MKLIRELPEQEIKELANASENCDGFLDPIVFAKALFEAAWIKQQVEK